MDPVPLLFWVPEQEVADEYPEVLRLRRRSRVQLPAVDRALRSSVRVIGFPTTRKGERRLRVAGSPFVGFEPRC
jgi:hypothetical protein